MHPHTIPSSGAMDHVASLGAVPDAFLICYLVGGAIALGVWLIGVVMSGIAVGNPTAQLHDRETIEHPDAYERDSGVHRKVSATATQTFKKVG